MDIKKKNQINLVVFITIVLILCGLMTFYMSKKEGFHEDEMFTYGSSNCTYDNLFQPHGKEDTFNKIARNYIIVEGNIGKTIENAWYYFTHQDEWNKLFSEISSKEYPVWKTREEARDYLTVSPNERFSYASVYYNQARDVHPPLYCILNHTVCSFFPDTFSKYFFFSISLVFFAGTCFIIRNILKLLNKEKLVIPAVLLYGLSIGAISTVIYARMYMMLAFFTLAYFYLTLKIYKLDFKMTRQTKILLGATTILGFLSQYYFCIFALGCFIVMIALMIKEKKWHELKSYIVTHIISALIGILVYPICIYQIFFSYRGVGTAGANGWYKSNVTVTIIAGSDEESGANKLRYNITGAQAVEQTDTATGTTSVTISTNGISTITAYTVDKAGNVSTAKTQTINRDNVEPIANITVGTKTETSIGISVIASDTISGLASNGTYKYYLNSEISPRETSTSNTYIFSGLTENTSYTLKVVVTDNAGNTVVKTITVSTNSLWAMSYSNESCTGKIIKPSSTTNPTTLIINNTDKKHINTTLRYNKPIKVGDNIEVKYKYIRSNNKYYFDFVVDGTPTYGTLGPNSGLDPGNSNKTLTFSKTVSAANNYCDFTLVKSDAPSDGYTCTLYIYDISINGNKIL